MKTLYKLLLSFFLIYISACDVLDVEPVSVISGSNFYQTAAHAEAAISAAYDASGQARNIRNWISFASIASDEADNVPGTSGSRDRMNRHQYTAARQGNTRDLWRDSYAAMQFINDVLLNVPNIGDPGLDVGNKREEILGEAYFLRGFLYFYLARFFGEVPVVLEVTNSVDPAIVNVTKDPLPAVFDQIISDLEEARSRLPASYDRPEFTRGRATVGAAEALLAKVYLWRAWKPFGEGQSDFQQAADFAQSVIDNPLYELVSGENYADIFKVGSQNSTEAIFEFQFENEEINFHRLNNEFQPAPIGRVRNVPTDKLLAAFDARPGDLRRGITIIPVPVPEENNGEPFYNGKFEQVGVDVTNVVMLRLADILLVRAEALNELGQTGPAIDALNTIRARAGLGPVAPATQAEVRSAILEERLVELAFEGKRWHDLNRHDITVQEVEEISAENGNLHHVLWPVPQADIDRNPNLSQNPGY